MRSLLERFEGCTVRRCSASFTQAWDGDTPDGLAEKRKNRGTEGLQVPHCCIPGRGVAVLQAAVVDGHNLVARLHQLSGNCAQQRAAHHLGPRACMFRENSSENAKFKNAHVLHRRQEGRSSVPRTTSRQVAAGTRGKLQREVSCGMHRVQRNHTSAHATSKQQTEGRAAGHAQHGQQERVQLAGLT